MSHVGMVVTVSTAFTAVSFGIAVLQEPERIVIETRLHLIDLTVHATRAT